VARHLARAVEIDPDHLPTRVLWARVLAQEGQVHRAIAELERVLSIDPATPGARPALSEAHLRLALLDARALPREEVLAHLRAAVELDPGAGRARAALGEELARGGEYLQAAEEFGRLVELSPEDPRAHLGRGMTLVLAGSYGRAREALEASLGSLPNHPALGDLLARLLATCPDPLLRDGQRAVTLAQSVVEIEPTLDHTETLAMALAEAGRWEEAVLWQRRVLADEQASSGSTSERRHRRLALYEQRQPVRAPWLGQQ
jgi:serine/threonine-protein kinase